MLFKKLNSMALKILSINPGTRYLSIAIFIDSRLLNWEIKVIKGKWSREKLEKIKGILNEIFETYQPNFLVIKRLHPKRCSFNLKMLLSKIKEFARKKRIKVFQYSIKEIEKFFSPEERINKKELAEILISRYPELTHELEKEKRNKNPYYFRIFEAIALGAVCFDQIG
jgi:Holliday junction resolvasome RuvABC endonuclease subunit